MCEALFSVDISNFTNFVLLDFNVDFNNPSCHTFSRITNLMHTFSLSQVVNTSTHFSHNGLPSLIDLVFVSNIHSLLECVVIPPLYLTPTTLDCQSYCSTVMFPGDLLFVGKYGETSMPISKEQTTWSVTSNWMKFLLEMISELAGLTLKFISWHNGLLYSESSSTH